MTNVPTVLVLALLLLVLVAIAWIVWDHSQASTEATKEEFIDPSADVQEPGRIWGAIQSNECVYEGNSDYTGVLTSPSLPSGMWGAEQIDDVAPGITRCYITNPMYVPPGEQSCSRNNSSIYNSAFYDLVSDISPVDMGPSIGTQCAVTFNSGKPQLFRDYLTFIEVSDPGRQQIIRDRDAARERVRVYEEIEIPAAKTLKQEKTSTRDARIGTVHQLDSTIASLSNQLAGLSKDLIKVRSDIVTRSGEVAAAQANIVDLEDKLGKATSDTASKEEVVKDLASKVKEYTFEQVGVYDFYSDSRGGWAQETGSSPFYASYDNVSWVIHNTTLRETYFQIVYYEKSTRKISKSSTLHMYLDNRLEKKDSWLAVSGNLEVSQAKSVKQLIAFKPDRPYPEEVANIADVALVLKP